MLKLIKRLFYKTKFVFKVIWLKTAWEKYNMINDDLKSRMGNGLYIKEYRRRINMLRGQLRRDAPAWDDLIGVSALSVISSPIENNEYLKKQVLELASVCTEFYIMLSQQEVDTSKSTESETITEHERMIMVHFSKEQETPQ